MVTGDDVQQRGRSPSPEARRRLRETVEIVNKVEPRFGCR